MMSGKLIIPVIMIFVFLGLPVIADNNIKTIALCFDDGPRPSSLKEILPVLEKYEVKASFFLEGALVLPNKNIIREMHDKGHAIENHSWGHENLVTLYRKEGAGAVRKTVKKCGNAILEATGRKPRFFRPPFWAINKEIEEIIVGEGYKVLKLNNPDINTMDYDDFAKKHPPEALINRVKSQITNREMQKIHNHVLVFHELTITAEALKTLIPYFQSQGYAFVLLDAIFP